jgi:phage-related protein
MPSSFPGGAVAPSFEIPLKKKPTTKVAQFGDGYSQRSKDGLNNIRRSWSLVWNDLTSAEKVVIDAFLETQGGYLAFNWTPPDEGSARLVSCAEWEVTFVGPDIYKLTAEFMEEIL